jgi:uracil-DNA glycosylase family 4
MKSTKENSLWEQLNKEIVACRRCQRLVEWREGIAHVKKREFIDCEYWGKPVVGFGDRHARLLIVGLAPGAHGSNRTGRMFTGDASGEFLFSALHRAGFASSPESRNREDSLVISNVFITALCRCAPPDNKPTKEEINNCREYLLREMELLSDAHGYVALGRMAFDQLKILLSNINPNSQSKPIHFTHGGLYYFQEHSPWLLASYHPSRQNTQMIKSR